MEFFTLNEAFQPNSLIENYESLIWTERYSKNGDFQIKSTDVNTMINALPKESYVGLRESTVPMIVEDHLIEKSIGGAAVVTITGRSFETVLERRAAVHKPLGSARTAWMVSAAKESDAAYRAMRTVLGDFPQYQASNMVLPLINPQVSVYDVIPEIVLTLPADYQVQTWSSTISYAEGDVVWYDGTSDSGVIYVATSLAGNLNKIPDAEPTFWTVLSSPGAIAPVTSNTYEIKPSDLYSTVLGLVNTNRRGLKAVRPISGETKVGIEIYNGADLTNEVVFDARFDQFDSARYLLTSRGSTNVAYVYGSTGSDLVLKTAAPEPIGLARRVLLFDESSDATTNDPDVRKSRGLIELYKYNATALFDGEIAIQVAEGYNTAYFLGDILKLVGEYGLSQNVRVAEFIRTSDATGDKAYPTFEAVEG